MIPVEEEDAIVAPVIRQVRDTMLLFGSEYVADSPLLINLSQVVWLVNVLIGAGHVIAGGRLFRLTITVLLLSLTLWLSGPSPVATAILVTLPEIISAAVTVCIAERI